MSQIWIDADAVPKKIKEVLWKAAWKRKVKMTFVANRWVETPRYPSISVEVVPAGLDKADDRIAEAVQKGDLVITADIPLAARCVESGGYIITPRGRVLDANNILVALRSRDFNEELRNAGIQTGGPKPMTPQDIQHFANSLDRWIQKNK
jgi:uncharacterized protein